MKTLILCAGLPRSGKSTWSRQQGHPIVNPDSIRLGLHGKAFEPLAEPMVWAVARLMVRALFLAGHDTVILDATNTTAHRVGEWRSPDWTIRVQFFLTSRRVCIERAAFEGNADLVPVIERMAKQWAHPLPLEPD